MKTPSYKRGYEMAAADPNSNVVSITKLVKEEYESNPSVDLEELFAGIEQAVEDQGRTASFFDVYEKNPLQMERDIDAVFAGLPTPKREDMH